MVEDMQFSAKVRPPGEIAHGSRLTAR